MGVAIPVSSRREYDEIFGDPRDPRWHLYANAAHLTPDAIDGFFANGGGNGGRLWITRLDLDGKARKADVILKNRIGADALRLVAANEGRWGGQESSVKWTPVVFATTRTFTLVAPGIRSNEFVGADAEFSGSPGRRYKIVANTEANSTSGEAIFRAGGTVGHRYL
jgi:hypothetical protein